MKKKTPQKIISTFVIHHENNGYITIDVVKQTPFMKYNYHRKDIHGAAWLTGKDALKTFRKLVKKDGYKIIKLNK